MSRIGKLPINIPENVDINYNESEITVKGIYLSIQGYRADGGLRYDPTDKEKSKYKFSVKLEAYQGGESATINFHIDKNSKDIAGDIVKKIKEQGVKKSLTGFTKDNKVELLESLTDKNTAGDDLATLPYLVANVLPVQYNVDRWILSPKIQEKKVGDLEAKKAEPISPSAVLKHSL